MSKYDPLRSTSLTATAQTTHAGQMRLYKNKSRTVDRGWSSSFFVTLNSNKSCGSWNIGRNRSDKAKLVKDDDDDDDDGYGRFKTAYEWTDFRRQLLGSGEHFGTAAVTVVGDLY